MRAISEKNLSIVIPLLSHKIREMDEELRHMGSNDEERCDLQQCVELYTNALATLRDEYLHALAAGFNLPSYEKLVGSDR